MSEPVQCRRIRGLIWAEFRDESPHVKPTGQQKRRFKSGNAYEKQVGRFLKRELQSGALVGELFLGQWVLFQDSNGRGYAEVDEFIVPPPPAPILLIEAKLTQTDCAIAQLISLYLPLLRKIYNRPIVCLQVCKNMRYIPDKFVESPQELLRNPGPGVFTWHYPAL